MFSFSFISSPPSLPSSLPSALPPCINKMARPYEVIGRSSKFASPVRMWEDPPVSCVVNHLTLDFFSFRCFLFVPSTRYSRMPRNQTSIIKTLILRNCFSPPLRFPSLLPGLRARITETPLRAAHSGRMNDFSKRHPHCLKG